MAYASMFTRMYFSRKGQVTRQVQMSFSVDEDLRRQAKIRAAQTGQTMASVLRECLRKWAEDPGPEPEEQGEEETQDS